MERHQAPSSPGRPILKVFLVNCHRGARGVYVYFEKYHGNGGGIASVENFEWRKYGKGRKLYCERGKSWQEIK